MPGLFNFDSGFGSSGGSDIEREYLDYLREKDAQVAAARKRAGDEAFAYQSKADDRDYGLKKETLKLKRQELLEIGIPQAKVDKWYKEAQIQLARETLIEDRRQFDAKFGEDQRQFNATFGEDQRQFNATTGLDVLKTGASLSGADNVFEQADFARGVQQRGDLPLFLEDLRSTGAAGLDAGPYSQQPTPLTLGSLTARLTGQGGAPVAGGGTRNDEAARALAAVTEIGMRPNKLAPMAIESLLPSEQKILGSGLGKSGFDREDWTRQYRQGGLGFGDFGAAA
jgi:hypothetical protein